MPTLEQLGQFLTRDHGKIGVCIDKMNAGAIKPWPNPDEPPSNLLVDITPANLLKVAGSKSHEYPYDFQYNNVLHLAICYADKEVFQRCIENQDNLRNEKNG